MGESSNHRETQIEKLFQQGKEFTEQLLRENERLRTVVVNSDQRIKELEGALDPERASLITRVTTLEDENSLLRRNLEDMKKQYNAIEKENWDFSERYLDVERQNSSLLNMYIATQRLHSTLRFGQVLEATVELVINLIGSESFEIALYDASKRRLVVISSVGTTATVGSDVLLEGCLAGSLDIGTVYVCEDDTTRSRSQLAACVPLKLDDHVLGALLIRQLLPQKSGFGGLDYELFDLFGDHVAAALFASFSLSKSNEWPNWSSAVDAMVAEATSLDESNPELRGLY